jgi:hypothetical protein
MAQIGAISASHISTNLYYKPRFLNVDNTAFDRYKCYLLAFGWTLRAFDNEQYLLAQVAKGTWLLRTALIREGIQNRDEAFRQDRSYNRIIAFLVP